MTAAPQAGGIGRELRRRLAVNGSQVDGWLWRARHAVRQRNARLACEAMLSALWLLGARDGQLAQLVDESAHTGGTPPPRDSRRDRALGGTCTPAPAPETGTDGCEARTGNGCQAAEPLSV